jgi:DNA segregation ATPase FtsK/SpoIIIE-like protein
MTDSTKVFIDTDNEITLILEKVLSAKSERVSLVIPDRASIFSSITGLKLIKRVVDKSNKLLVLVTLDAQGASLAGNAGLYVVSRVGEINEDIWEKAQKAKFEVMKRDTRSHYLPDNVSASHAPVVTPITAEPLITSEAVEESEPDTAAEFTDIELIAEADQEIEEAVQELLDEPIVLDETIPEQEVPQVRINIDVNDIPESTDTQLMDQEQVLEEEVEPMPSFLARETQTPAQVIELKADDEVVEKNSEALHTVPAQTIDMNTRAVEEKRIRKVAPRSSGIKNLSFAVGKDIDVEKKK